jgi:hypothetical protein
MRGFFVADPSIAFFTSKHGCNLRVALSATSPRLSGARNDGHFCLVAVDGELSYPKPYNPSSGVKQIGPRVATGMQQTHSAAVQGKS